MAKSRPRKSHLVPPLPLKRRPIRKADPCAAVKTQCKAEKAEIRKAAAVVAQVVAHFGAGFAVQREQAGLPSNRQIFGDPAALATFADLLLTSVLKNTPNGKLNWDTDQVQRDAVCLAAFQHGDLAGQRSPSAPLTFAVIFDTLREIQSTVCPPGAGGGPVCDF